MCCVLYLRTFPNLNPHPILKYSHLVWSQGTHRTRDSTKRKRKKLENVDDLAVGSSFTVAFSDGDRTTRRSILNAAYIRWHGHALTSLSPLLRVSNSAAGPILR